MLLISEEERDRLIEYLVKSILPSRDVQALAADLKRLPEAPKEEKEEKNG